MQDKIELVEDEEFLPPELQYQIAEYLPTSEFLNFFEAIQYSPLFRPLLDDHQTIHFFLQHVVRGEHEAVREMLLTEDIHLIFKRGCVTDCSGRTFESISAFEYALWALDEPMWMTMLECIPQNKEGNQVFARLGSQYNKVTTKGVRYSLNGEATTENHFDFELLIQALRTQVELINAPGIKDWDAIDTHWREVVGNAQRDLPMHVVFEYCSNQPFWPLPEFNSEPKSSQQFYNFGTRQYENWFAENSKLGVDFAIYLARCRVGLPLRIATGGAVAAMLDAILALCEVRTLAFINLGPLRLGLEGQTTVDNQPPVVPM